MSRSSKKKQKRGIQENKIHSRSSVTSSHQEKDVVDISSTSDVSASMVPSELPVSSSAKKHKRRAHIKQTDSKNLVISSSSSAKDDVLIVSAPMMSLEDVPSVSLADELSHQEQFVGQEQPDVAVLPGDDSDGRVGDVEINDIVSGEEAKKDDQVEVVETSGREDVEETGEEVVVVVEKDAEEASEEENAEFEEIVVEESAEAGLEEGKKLEEVVSSENEIMIAEEKESAVSSQDEQIVPAEEYPGKDLQEVELVAVEEETVEHVVVLAETALDPIAAKASSVMDNATPSDVVQLKKAVKKSRIGQSIAAKKVVVKPQKKRFSLWKRLLLVAVVLMLLTVGGGFGYYQFVVAPQVNGILGYQAIHHTYSLTTPATAQATSSATQLPVASPTSTPTVFIPNDVTMSGKNRINILLLGSDNDGKNGNNDQPLAQTDIVVTINQQTDQVGMLSIPRDLQVTIPGFGSHKMDFAFSDGWSEGTGDNASHAASAAGLVEDTIAYNYGIHIDYYAWVGLEGFVKVIDTAGGVDVDVAHPMVDDNYPYDVANSNGGNFDYQRVYIEAGPQHMDGVEALEYVRTRHSDLIGDFGRSQRQQQVISQLKEKLSTPTIIANADQLLSELDGAVLTDMQLDDVLYLANLARSIDLKNVSYLTLSSPYSSPRSSEASDTNFVPNCSDVIPAISQMFAIQATCLTQYQTGEASVTPQLVTGSAAALASSDTSSPPISLFQDSAVVSRTLLSSNLNEASAVHGILDILFMATFESPDAAQI